MASHRKLASQASRAIAVGPSVLPERLAVSARVPIIVCNAGYYGSLAAIRSLGRAGVPVVTTDTTGLSAGRYSRYSSEHLVSPAVDTSQWVDWLIAEGRKGPRRAIYATSDAVSFALAEHREKLASLFDMYQPDLDTMMRVLDKGVLYDHARAVGIDTPETWFPRSIDEANAVIRDVGGMFIAKPRSQLAVRTGIKGLLVDAARSRALEIFGDLVRQGAQDNSFVRRFPETKMPMLQRYYPEAMETIYTLSGFRDQSGRHVVMRAARKILQRPRRIGIGLCFEEAEVVPELAERTSLLCQRIGYFGAFELEFIVANGQAMLIDFNGRLYNQLAFDIARGMDLPGLVYAGATKDKQMLVDLAAACSEHDCRQKLIFCDRSGLSLTVAAQRVFGHISPEEARRWREWRAQFDGRIVDPIRDADDPVPAYVDAAQQVFYHVRHPRSLVREYARERRGPVCAAL